MKFLMLLILPAFAHASLLEVENSKELFSGVAVATSAKTVLEDGSTLALSPAGIGLRTKMMGVAIPVYVGQLFVADLEQFAVPAPDRALEFIARNKLVAMQLTFLREVSNDKLTEAFSDCFEANGLSADAVAKEVLAFAKRSGDFSAKKTLTVTAENLADGSQLVQVENAQGEILKIPSAGPDNANAKVMSLWLGTLPKKDSGLLKFKTALISKAKAEFPPLPAPIPEPTPEPQPEPAPNPAPEETAPAPAAPSAPADDSGAASDQPNPAGETPRPPADSGVSVGN